MVTSATMCCLISLSRSLLCSASNCFIVVISTPRIVPGCRGYLAVLHRYSRGRRVTNIQGQGRGLLVTGVIFGRIQERVGFYFPLAKYHKGSGVRLYHTVGLGRNQGGILFSVTFHLYECLS